MATKNIKFDHWLCTNDYYITDKNMKKIIYKVEKSDIINKM